MVLTNLNNAKNNSVSNIDELCDVLSQNLEPDEFDFMNTINDAWNKIKNKIPLLISVIILLSVFCFVK